MITLLLANWKLVVIGILSALLSLTFAMWRHEVHAFDMFKAQVEVMGKQAEVKKKETEAKQNQILKETGDAWAKNLDAVRNNSVNRYRMRGGSSGGAMPGLAIRTEKLDGTGKEQLACEPGFIADAAEDAAKVAAWQEWARRLGLPVK